MAETPLLVLYTFLCILVVATLIKLKRRASTGGGVKLNPPPGPWALPVIGHMHYLLGALPHHAMERLAKRHGPVMLLRLGHVPTLVISSPEAAREVMKTHEAPFTSRPVFATADIVSYGGQDIAFAPYGSKHWKELRRLCTTELLSPKRVLSFRPVREEEAAALVRAVVAAAAGVNVSDRIKVFMNDVIMRVSVGDRCAQREVYLEELDRLVDLASGFNLTDLFPTSRLARALGGGTMRAAREMRGRMQALMDAMIEDHTSAMENGKEASLAGNAREDLLTLLLRFQRDGRTGITLTTENVSGVLFDVFSAGSETTATTAIWAISELLRNPRVMKRAQSEVRQVLHGKTTVAEADIRGQLPYLELVVKETFRLHPPIPLLLPRICSEPTKVMGYDVPQGATMFVNVSAFGRDERIWAGADEFRPERFEDEAVDYKATDFRFIPAGAGKRMCPGMMFALYTMEIALASLLYHFDWKLPGGSSPGELDMTEAFGVTARRKTDLVLEATPFLP